MDPLDFSPLDGPLEAGEGRARRRSLLGGRSLVAELSEAQWGALITLGLVWLVALLVIGVALSTTFSWLITRGPTPDFLSGAPIIVGASVLAVGLLIVLTRVAIGLPRWGRWVRMQRFAEQNDLVFIRTTTSRAGLPAVVPRVGAGISLLSDAFVDPVSGVVVGNAGAGWGRRGFVLLPGDAPPVEGELAPGEQPLGGFDFVDTQHGLLALRHRAVSRSSASIRRLFATADAVRRGDQAAIR